MSNPLAGNPLATRHDVQRSVRDLFAPLVPAFSEGCARVSLGSSAAWFSDAAAELEGFERPLWGIVPLVADGGEFAHWDLYVRGIANGTDPGHPEYWGPLTGPDQRMVEMAAIGFALLLTPDHVWESLDPAQRRNLAAWLGAVDSHEPHPNNWQFFRVLVNLGLAHVGVEYDEEAQKRSLDRIDDFHVGDGWYRDGWYRDGVLGSHDHYVAFALHFYGLLYAARGPEPERERSIRFRDRARLFAPQYARWFDRHGRSVPYGHRSLTYRFTHASFWGALAVAGEEALPWGQVKGLYLRHLRSWRDRPIADRSGVLTVGYGYESQLLSEEYNSPGSPYWAMKAFVPLMLPDDHPFWAAEEEEEGCSPTGPRRARRFPSLSSPRTRTRSCS